MRWRLGVSAHTRARPRPRIQPSLSLTHTWYSMDGSYRLLRQMAHVSVQMAHDHMATAFHFLTSKRGPAPAPPAAAALALPLASAAAGAAVPASTSMASPMVCCVCAGVWVWGCACEAKDGELLMPKGVCVCVCVRESACFFCSRIEKTIGTPQSARARRARRAHATPPQRAGSKTRHTPSEGSWTGTEGHGRRGAAGDMKPRPRTPAPNLARQSKCERARPAFHVPVWHPRAQAVVPAGVQAFWVCGAAAGVEGAARRGRER